MSHPSRLAFLLLGSTLALGFFLGSDRIAAAVAHRRAQPDLTVRGVATQPAKADTGTLTYQLHWRGENYAGGRALLERRRDELVARLRAAGIPEADILVRAQGFQRYLPAPAGTKPEHLGGFARGPAPDFSIAQAILIRTGKVEVLARLALEPVEYVDEVIVARGAPAYRIVQLDEARRDLLEAATKDARRRAEILVAGSGSRVGALLEASQGMFEVTSPENPGDDFDTTAIDKVVRVVVSLRFEIVRE